MTFEAFMNNALNNPECKREWDTIKSKEDNIVEDLERRMNYE